VRATVRDRKIEAGDWQRLRQLLEETRSAERAFARANEHAAKAKAHLSVFPPSLERDALMALPDYVLARDR
jgi:geranylgeranyl pyrophosphate synthase